MSEIYCGAKKVPKGKREGTKEECIKKSQIRRYGLSLVNPDDMIRPRKKQVKKAKVEKEVVILPIKEKRGASMMNTVVAVKPKKDELPKIRTQKIKKYIQALAPVGSKQEKIKKINSEIVKLKSDNESLMFKSKDIEEILENKSIEYTNVEKQLKRAKPNKIQELKKKLDDLEVKINVLDKERSDIYDEWDKNQRRVQKLEDEEKNLMK